MPAAKKPKALKTMKDRIHAVLIYLYRRTEGEDFADPIPLADVARDTGLPMPLVVKISKHLEAHGMLEYEHGEVDLTVAGMIEAEAAEAPPPAKLKTT